MKPFSEMTDAEIAEFIAKKMGWGIAQRGAVMEWRHFDYIPNDRKGARFFLVMDEKYHDDFYNFYWNPMLNENLFQCWIFEEWIKKDVIKNDHYWNNLTRVLPRANSITIGMIGHATAHHRCEAFINTFGEGE